MKWPIAKINVRISDVNKVYDTLVIFDYCFQVAPWDVVGAWDR